MKLPHPEPHQRRVVLGRRAAAGRPRGRAARPARACRSTSEYERLTTASSRWPRPSSARGARRAGHRHRGGVRRRPRARPRRGRGGVLDGDGAGGERLRRTRPTAVNLAWALERMARVAASRATLAGRARAPGGEARAIHREDVAACRAMGAHRRRARPRRRDDPHALQRRGARDGRLRHGARGHARGARAGQARARRRRARRAPCSRARGSPRGSSRATAST